MYGGTMRSGHVSRELWALDLTTLIWERVETSQGQCMASDSAKLCGPINSMGHTAHVVSNRMIVIFGHSPKYGYLDTVQEYHFFNKVYLFLTLHKITLKSENCEEEIQNRPLLPI